MSISGMSAYYLLKIKSVEIERNLNRRFEIDRNLKKLIKNTDIQPLNLHLKTKALQLIKRWPNHKCNRNWH